MKFIVFVFLSIVAIGCSRPKDPFQRLERLQGTWHTHNSETDIYEEWYKPDENSILYGKSYAMNGGDSMVFERVELRKEGGAIFFVPTVKENSGPVPFQLISHENETFIFENKQHDFPQRVIYRFVKDDSLVGRIEGINKGEPMSQDFYYSRVK